MKQLPLPTIVLALVILLGCKKSEMNIFPAPSQGLLWQGRTYEDSSGHRYLIGSASSLKFRYTGQKCRIWLQNAAPPGEYNYISIIIDGVRQSRRAIHFDTLTPLEILPATVAEFHDIELYKETEASNGQILISAIEAESIGEFPSSIRKKIEFIGNSITVGMAADESLVPCEAGTWYDQHNAYDTYGARVARGLDMDYMISGVSGMGIYRNWNTDGPVMGDVYESAFFNADPNSPRWNFKTFVPDIVSICLGTNDFSDGDGVTPRLPFDTTRFIASYVSFLKIIHGHYPDAQIVINTTPMVEEEKNRLTLVCLEKIKSKTESGLPGLKPIIVFNFSLFHGQGCTGHPSVADHERMAVELIPMIRSLKK